MRLIAPPAWPIAHSVGRARRRARSGGCGCGRWESTARSAGHGCVVSERTCGQSKRVASCAEKVSETEQTLRLLTASLSVEQLVDVVLGDALAVELRAVEHELLLALGALALVLV